MSCDQTPMIHALADGELPAEVAERTRDHLADCAVCQAELAEIVQLEAAVSEVAVRARAGVTPLRRRRWRTVVTGAALAAAAATAVYLVRRPRVPGGAPEDGAEVAQLLPSERSSEARLSWAGVAAHRPYRIVRSADTMSTPIPLGALSDLDRRGDFHGVGALALLNGDHRQAEAFFRRAPASAALASDRAALALAEGQPERALALTEEALGAQPEHAAATWNRALALRDLGLPLAAAAAFSKVAARAERGWADEARARGAELTGLAEGRKALTERVLGAGPRLAREPSALSVEEAKRLPGLVRVYLYDALRSAEPAQLTALAPLVEAVEGRGGPMAALAERTRALFGRAPDLVRTYGEIAVAKQLPSRAAYLARLRAAGAADQLIGALIHLSPSGYVVAESELPELARLGEASSDPWFRALALEQRAQVALAQNRLAEAEAVLLRARGRCASGEVPAYRCMRASLLLSDVYARWHRLDEARAEKAHAWKLARAEGEWLTESILLSMESGLASAADEATGSRLPLARAYAEELSLRQPASACNVAISARYDLALAEINQLRFDEARRELAALPPCDAALDPLDALRRVLVRAHLIREDLRTARGAQLSEARTKLAELRAEIATLRQQPGLPPAYRAFLDHCEGRAVIDADLAEGERLLRGAISAARALAAEPAMAADAVVKRASAFSFSVLALAKARAGDGAGALAALADEQGAVVPARCALGIAVEDQRRMAVVRGADGQLSVAYDERRASISDDVRAVITAPQLAALAPCEVVDVLARPPVHGTSRLLPETMAWRFLAARRAPRGAAKGPALVVADVEPPAALGLPRLATWSLSGRTLSGASATPERVLAAMADAGEVVVHAHGIGSRESGDAAFLALSADAGGRYALTASDVRATTLRGSPLVVLAACNASIGAPRFHEPWSLPTAFVFAGARAVIASTAPIPDAEASELLDAVRASVAAGAPVAVALRDARQRWLAAGRGEWVKDLLVFE